MESARFGLRTYANELNPVASFILKCSILFPTKFGLSLVDDLERWGKVWQDRVVDQLKPYYSVVEGERTHTYIFARTVACPETGKEIPLLYSFWLRRVGEDPVALEMVADPAENVCGFRVVSGDEIGFDPGPGTVSRGKAISPWSSAVVEGDYIKAEAQAGRMGVRLVAVYYRDNAGVKRFRVPNQADLDALDRVKDRLEERWDELYDMHIPSEEIPRGSKTSELLRYGMYKWHQLFTARQLYALAVCSEVLAGLWEEMVVELGEARAKAVRKLIAAAISKIADYNSVGTLWETSRNVIAHAFARHDFSYKWGFAEMDLCQGGGVGWALVQVTDAYKKICKLLEPTRNVLFPTHTEDWADDIRVTNGDGADLAIEDGSVEAIVMDPPYYDNIQYSELSDFFYVWLKRTAGPTCPDWFDSYLSEKDREAVANPARFIQIDPKRAKVMARDDYERKMVRIFGEAGRVLRDDGVLTVMFNHKTVEAWDTLARSIVEAGFQIVSSWPVHTESQHSLHQARKAAVASTIMLGCRKRLAHEANGSDVWWEDIKDDLKGEVERCASEFLGLGIGGVDLFVSVFGPALSVISQRWPVLLPELDRSGRPRVLSPDDALDLARGVVVGLLRDRLVGGRRVDFDGVSDWYLLAWDVFSARSFPYDEARKLALAFGVGMDDLRRSKLVSKKTSNTVLTNHDVRFPKERVSGFDAEDLEGVCLVDRAHMLMSVAVVDRTAGIDEFVRRGKLTSDPSFVPYLQALLKVIPRTRDKDRKFLVPEAHALDEIAVALSLDLPTDPPPPTSNHHQTTMNLEADSQL